MAKFIELTNTTSGNKQQINLEYVVKVIPLKDSGTKLILAPDAEAYYYQESYDDVSKLLGN